MLNIYVLNKNWLITHHIYIYTLYLHYIYNLFFTLFIVIYSLHYLYFLLDLLISIFLFILFIIITFFCGTIFLTQCVSLLVDKRVVLSLLLHNLTFSCPRSQDDDPVRDCITHEIKVYAYNNNTNINSNSKNTSNNNNTCNYSQASHVAWVYLNGRCIVEAWRKLNSTPSAVLS